MAFSDNRAARRRANFFRSVLEVGKKIAIVVVSVGAVIGVLLGASLFLAERATTKALAVMKAQPQPMLVSDMTGDQLAQLVETYDPDFYSHKGFSTKAPGLNTITQRIVRQYYFNNYQAWLEWIATCFDGWALNRRLTKDEQLKIYINTVALGTSREHEVRGLQEAAALFFDKKFRELNRDEYLQILAMIEDPDKFHIQAEAMANIDRANRLKKLVEGKCKRAGVFDTELKNCGGD